MLMNKHARPTRHSAYPATAMLPAVTDDCASAVLSDTFARESPRLCLGAHGWATPVPAGADFLFYSLCSQCAVDNPGLLACYCDVLVRFKANKNHWEMHDKAVEGILQGIHAHKLLKRSFCDRRLIVTLLLTAFENAVSQLSRCLPHGSVLTLEPSNVSIQIVKATLDLTAVASVHLLVSANQDSDVTVQRIHERGLNRGAKQTLLVALIPRGNWHNLTGGDDSVFSSHGRPCSVETSDLVSDVVSLSIYHSNGSSIHEADIYITFSHHLRTTGLRQPRCVFWDTESHRWSQQGCHMLTTNATHTHCWCQHLSSFGVLINLVKGHQIVHQEALRVLAIIGTVVSGLCLLITVATFIYFRNLKTDRNIIHTHLAATLMLANTFFLFNDLAAGNFGLCLAVTLLAHYLYLCAFAWMLIEGIQLLFLFGRPKHTIMTRSRWYIVFVLGYVSPLVIVVLTAVICRDNYAAKDYCWLSVLTGAIWSFAGPVICVLLFNSAVLAFSVYMMLAHSFSSQAAWHQGIIRRLGIWLKGSCMLLYVLGLPWVFGMLDVSEDTTFLSFFFVIGNSMQGVGIFILYCFFNEKVCGEYYRFIQSAERMPKWLKTVLGNVIASRAKRKSIRRSKSGRRRSIWRKQSIKLSPEDENTVVIEKLRANALEMLIAGWDPEGEDDEDVEDDNDDDFSSDSYVDVSDGGTRRPVGLKFVHFSQFTQYITSLRRETHGSTGSVSIASLEVAEGGVTQDPHSQDSHGSRVSQASQAFKRSWLSTGSTDKHFTSSLFSGLFRKHSDDNMGKRDPAQTNETPDNQKVSYDLRGITSKSAKTPVEIDVVDMHLPDVDEPKETDETVHVDSVSAGCDTTNTSVQTTSDETAQKRSENMDATGRTHDEDTVQKPGEVIEDTSATTKPKSTFGRLRPALAHACLCCCGNVRPEVKKTMSPKGETPTINLSVVQNTIAAPVKIFQKEGKKKRRKTPTRKEVPPKPVVDSAVPGPATVKKTVSPAFPSAFFVDTDDSLTEELSDSAEKTGRLVFPSAFYINDQDSLTTSAPADPTKTLVPFNVVLDNSMTSPSGFVDQDSSLLNPTSFFVQPDDSITDIRYHDVAQPGPSRTARGPTCDIMAEVVRQITQTEEDEEGEEEKEENGQVDVKSDEDSTTSRAKLAVTVSHETHSLMQVARDTTDWLAVQTNSLRGKVVGPPDSTTPRSIMKGEMRLLDVMAGNRDPSIRIKMRGPRTQALPQPKAAGKEESFLKHTQGGRLKIDKPTQR